MGTCLRMQSVATPPQERGATSRLNTGAHENEGKALVYKVKPSRGESDRQKGKRFDKGVEG